jgi:hypothetical protein
LKLLLTCLCVAWDSVVGAVMEEMILAVLLVSRLGARHNLYNGCIGMVLSGRGNEQVQFGRYSVEKGTM